MDMQITNQTKTTSIDRLGRWAALLLGVVIAAPAAYANTLSAEAGSAEAGSGDALSTVSDRARDFIENNSPQVHDPQSLEEWEALSGAVGEPGVLTEAGNAALASFGATITLQEIDGAQHLLVEPGSFDPVNEDRIILYVHGGAYTLARPELVVASYGKIADLTQTRVLGIRYPLAWQAPRPADSDRVLAVYREMLKTHAPQHIVMVGDSAGGGLIMTSVLRMRDEGLPMPAALGLLSPWADISKTGTSLYTLANGGDPIIDWGTSLAASARLYASELALTDPSVSPLYADFTQGFPPSYISTGTRDLFLSHCARLQRRLTDAGVENSLFVYEGMWHVFQQDLELPESEAAWRDLAAFLEQHWAR
jgi:monoterpene epsilon-lactone hydrolase